MSRKERAGGGRPDALGALLDAGDHAGARAVARRMLSDGAATADERASAARALSSLQPEPGAVAVGVIAALLAAGVTLWTILGGR